MVADESAGRVAAPETAERPLWTLTYHGYARVTNGGDEVIAEEPVRAELRVSVAGNWVVCGADGGVLLADDDPGHLDRLALCLLGRVVGPIRPPG